MSKAEERALSYYTLENFDTLTMLELGRKCFLEGYEQAEKDLSLTVQDIQLIHRILSSEIVFVSTHPYIAYKNVLEKYYQLKNQ